MHFFVSPGRAVVPEPLSVFCFRSPCIRRRYDCHMVTAFRIAFQGRRVPLFLAVAGTVAGAAANAPVARVDGRGPGAGGARPPAGARVAGVGAPLLALCCRGLATSCMEVSLIVGCMMA